MFPSHSRDSGLAMPHLTDSAFEPHSTFAFDEAAASDFHDGQHELPSLDEFEHSMNQHHDLIDRMTEVRYGYSDSPGVANEAGEMHMYRFHKEPMPPSEMPWTAEHAPLALSPQPLQVDTEVKLHPQVHQCFGQITPPDDDAPPIISAGSVQRPPVRSTSTTLSSQPSAKSERARNAANQRHGKVKKSRRDSGIEILSPESEGVGSSEDKREKYREKNRLAAAKCRAKKKNNVEDLEERARHATALNSQLKLQARELRDVFSELRSHALMHDASQGCPCQQIHMYNAKKAQEAARGAVTLPAFLNVSLHDRDLVDTMAATSSAGFEALTSRQNTPGMSQGRPTHCQHPIILHDDLSSQNDVHQDQSLFANLGFEED